MTLNDFLKRVNKDKDGHKMLLHISEMNGEEGWANVEIAIKDYVIEIRESKKNSPFSSDN